MDAERFRHRAITIASTALVVVLVAGLAQARVVRFDELIISGAGAKWDVERSTTGCESQAGFSPVGDGEYRDETDAFDGGQVLIVGGNGWKDGDGRGVVTRNDIGDHLKVGPNGVSGLHVTRRETAFNDFPVLRSLIGFRNMGNAPVVRNVLMDSDLGSDTAETTRASSAPPNTSFTEADRWNVSWGDTSDPSLTFAWYDRGNPRERIDTVLEPGEGSGCIEVMFRIRVNPGDTVYLMFFIEMRTGPNGSISNVDKFDNVNPGHKLLAGIGGGVQDRILNWDLN